ncbi:hypothetical protein Tco_1011981 [Tanacetum coccineum]
MEPTIALTLQLEITLTLEKFAHILKIPYQGVCVYTPDWPISSLQYVVDPHLNIYPPPQEDSSLIHDALFYKRTFQARNPKDERVETILDPFQMIVSELKIKFKKWEIILSENVISLTGNKDQPNACLCYMLYYLAIEKPFDLAYYIANRMKSVTKSANLYTFPTESHHPTLCNTFEKSLRFKDKGKRPRILTLTPPDTESSDLPSPTPHQEVENDPVDNYTIDPVPYMNHLPPIKGGDSSKFKQTKGMFKCQFSISSQRKVRLSIRVTFALV